VALGVDVDFIGAAGLVLLGRPADRLPDFLHRQPILTAQFPLHLVEHRGGLTHLLALPGEPQLILPVGDLNPEGIANHAQMAIRGPKKGQLLIRLFKCNAKVHCNSANGVRRWLMPWSGSGMTLPPTLRPSRQMGRATSSRIVTPAIASVENKSVP
jgi:hypothetical protein